MRKGWTMALNHGGEGIKLARLGYKKIKRPIFHLNADMDKPNLKARLLPVSNQLNLNYVRKKEFWLKIYFNL